MHFSKHHAAITVAMREPETFVLCVKYLDVRGNVTERKVSPISLTRDAVLVYCLGRQGVRSLKLTRLLQVQFSLASEVLAPEAIKLLINHNRNRRQTVNGNDGPITKAGRQSSP